MEAELPQGALQVALAAADASRELIGAHFARGVEVETKADDSPVTAADREAEAIIRRIIRTAFPSHALVGEEHGSEGAGEWTWLVDPIDGTLSFIHGLPLFATLIALCRNDEPVLAVIDLPGLRRRLHAVAGGGAWEGRTQLGVAPGFDPARSLVCHGDRYAFEAAGRGALYDTLDHSLHLFRSFTDAFGHTLVAGGCSSLMVDPDLKVWDAAAPALLVREAGGVARTHRDPDGAGLLLLTGSPEAIDWVEQRL